MSGRVVHFEIPFDDGDRARRFYKEAFGWQLQEMPGDGATRWSMSGPERRHRARPSPGSSTAACWRARRAPPPARSSSSTSTSIDDALETIERLGGSHRRRPRQPVGDMGFAAYVKDPEGNVDRPLGDRAPGLTPSYLTVRGPASPSTAREDPG